MFRRTSDKVEVFLVHPGGPFWKNKDLGAWSLPKGEFTEGEDAFAAAKREFEEETGLRPGAEFVSLGESRQPGGKLVIAWAFEGDCDPSAIHSNLCSLEWPRGSGKIHEFPEVDRGAWFSFPRAHEKILKGQRVFLERLAEHLGTS